MLNNRYEVKVIRYFFSDEVAAAVKAAIDEYGGGEIFFGCNLDEEGEINGVEPVCYGNEEAVLAPYEIAEKYNAILHNHPSGNVQPSSADMNYANLLQNQGIGFLITDNEASRVNVVVPPIKIRKSDKIGLAELDRVFEDGGLISEHKEGYEFREGQLKMSHRIMEAFNENKIAVIEAGTGIGKSLAYLIPAFLWAEKNNERVVVSTNTINLQSQLLNKDIPFVKKILGSQVEAVLVKGRRNYLCKLKLYNLENELEFGDEEEELNSIINWSTATEGGVIDELTFVPAHANWEKVSSDSDFCTGSQCIFYQECFLQKARRRATEANVLVVNHHILFADLQLRYAGRGMQENILLPPYKKLIFDEAHNIEKSASAYFTNSFSKSGFYKFIKLFRGKGNRSFLKKIQQKLQKSSHKNLFSVSEFIVRDVIGALDLLYAQSFEIFDRMNGYLQGIIERSDYYGSKLNIQYRVKKEEWESPIFQTEVIGPMRDFANLIENFNRAFKELNEIFNDVPERIRDRYETDFKLVKSYSSKLSSYFKGIMELLEHDPDKNVGWIELFGSEESPLFNLVSSPLYVNGFLNECLHGVYDSIVFASATFTVNNTFNYFFNLSGLSLVKEREVSIDIFHSPFQYDKQVLFVAPVDIPEPRSPLYNEKLNSFLQKSIEITRGSAFALFTSYAQLKRSFEEVSPYLREQGYRSFYQGEMEKQKLLDRFIGEKHSTLFATDSFWEGVDAPGETLRYVVMTKLPFKMPTEPIEEARVEDMEKRDLNPFLNYTLPSAVIKFRQGFGRLIRTKSDYGIVALMDTRVLTKSYGKMFFHSLPRCKFVGGNSELVLDAIREHVKEWN